VEDNSETSILIQDSTLSTNTAGTNGGTIIMDNEDVSITLKGNIFLGNTAETGNGGVVYAEECGQQTYSDNSFTQLSAVSGSLLYSTSATSSLIEILENKIQCSTRYKENEILDLIKNQ